MAPRLRLHTEATVAVPAKSKRRAVPDAAASVLRFPPAAADAATRHPNHLSAWHPRDALREDEAGQGKEGAIDGATDSIQFATTALEHAQKKMHNLRVLMGMPEEASDDPRAA